MNTQKEDVKVDISLKLKERVSLESVSFLQKTFCGLITRMKNLGSY